MMERDALWWEVQARCGRTPELTDQLWKYLLGTEDFATVALDALEAAALEECPECADRELAGDDDADDEAEDAEDDEDEVDATEHLMEAEEALARYKRGEPAARVLVDLLEAILGAEQLEGIARARRSAQCEAVRSRVERQRANLSKLQQGIAKNAQKLAAMEAALAEHTSLPAKRPSRG